MPQLLVDNQAHKYLRVKSDRTHEQLNKNSGNNHHH